MRAEGLEPPICLYVTQVPLPLEPSARKNGERPILLADILRWWVDNLHTSLPELAELAELESAYLT